MEAALQSPLWLCTNRNRAPVRLGSLLRIGYVRLLPRFSILPEVLISAAKIYLSLNAMLVTGTDRCLTRAHLDGVGAGFH